MKKNLITILYGKQIEGYKGLSFALPSAKEIVNGKSLAYQSQYLLGCRFAFHTDYVLNQVRIIKRRKEV